MKRLRVGILDLLTNTPNEPWFEARVMGPHYGSIMPQCVAVWAEQLGCEVIYETFTGREDLNRCMPDDLDLLFISCFSRGSFLAYAISMAYRRRGVVTVLGGPHARSFVEHARPYFDYLCQLTDHDLIRALLQGFSRHDRAVVLSAATQPTSIPGVRERARFVQANMDKALGRRVLRTVPMIGSVGCPYSCNFCVDARIPYHTLPYDQLVEDLRFVRQRFGEGTAIFWHDPNFGVRFDDYMDLIERSGSGLMHGAETTLSLLGEENLTALQRNKFVALVPGVESWYDFGAKGGGRRLAGIEKVRHVAAHINLIEEYVPYVQANFVLGLDSDAGDEPFELTKKFLDLAPGAFPGYSLVTDFQNSPLSEQLVRESRTLNVPHCLLDNNFAMNVRLKNYTPLGFYDRLIDLFEYTWSLRAGARRFRVNRLKTVKVVNVGRALTEGRGRLNHHRRIRALLARDRDFARFCAGDEPTPPRFYFDAVRQQLGKYAALLPRELANAAEFVESVRRTTPTSQPVIPPENLDPSTASPVN